MRARSTDDPAVRAYRERLDECVCWVECLMLNDPDTDDDDDTLPGEDGEQTGEDQ